MAVIFAFSARHGGGHLPAAEVVLRKLAHVTEYLILTLLLAARAAPLARSRPRVPVAIVAALAYAASATSGTSRSSPAAPRRRATSRSTASASRSLRSPPRARGCGALIA